MHWQLWHHAGSKEFPQNIQTALATQYNLDAEATGCWHFLDQSDKFAGRPVRSFRIFDPEMVIKEGKIPLKYRDLDRDANRKAILFEGYIEKEGYVILKDRRPKQKAPAQVGA